MEINEKLKQIIENAYIWLDHDGDGTVSLSDLKTSCQISNSTEALDLFQSLKSPHSSNPDTLTFHEFYSGITEFPGILSEFLSSLQHKSQDLSRDTLDLSFNFEGDISERLCEAISVLSNIANCFQEHCKFYNTEELIEILHQTIQIIRMKYKTRVELRDFIKGLVKLYVVIRAQYLNYSRISEEFHRKISDCQLNFDELNYRYQSVVRKNEKFIEKITSMEKLYNDTVKELEKHISINIELSKRSSIDESEESTRVAERQQELEKIEQKIKRYFTVNMFIESQKNTPHPRTPKNLNRSHYNFHIDPPESPSKSHEFLLNQLKNKNSIIKDKDEELGLTLDLITSLRMEIAELKEERNSLIVNQKKADEKFTELKSYLDSDTSFHSLQNFSEISYDEPSDCGYLLKPRHQHKDSHTQTSPTPAKARNNCLWWF